MKYIESFHEGDQIRGVYFCKNKTAAVTKTGKPYENVVLQDKTGVIDSKVWDPGSGGIEEYEKLDYVDIVGDIVSFNGALQLNIKRLRRAEEGEYDPQDYFPISENDIEEMYGELVGFIDSVREPHLRRILEMFFKENEAFARAFKSHSAAKSVHHGFIGGLLEHTLSVTKMCDFYTTLYPLLNRDLLITAAICHDIGKLQELSDFPENDYTDEGQMLGHIVQGIELIGIAIRKIEGFPTKLATELKHCIAAHHGELEYGSPKKPAIIEAVALNFADNTDAKLETLKEAFSNVAEGNTEWLGYNRLVESNIRRTSIN
ncbi:MAG: HD domain-containing protein [Lachnospiraceae bacterium]|nr:HD domain-containing protein [Lachnospiraceae bacterium]